MCVRENVRGFFVFSITFKYILKENEDGRERRSKRCDNGWDNCLDTFKLHIFSGIINLKRSQFFPRPSIECKHCRKKLIASLLLAVRMRGRDPLEYFILMRENSFKSKCETCKINLFMQDPEAVLIIFNHNNKWQCRIERNECVIWWSRAKKCGSTRVPSDDRVSITDKT